MKKLLLLLFFCSANAFAESSYVQAGGNSQLTSSADLKFEITVPKILFFQVGQGDYFLDNASSSLISFNVPSNQLNTSNPIPATLSSGDMGNGTVSVKLIGNNGNITLSATTSGPLLDANGNNISFSQIQPQVSTLSSVIPVPSPNLVDNSTQSINIPSSNYIVNQDALWTYSYLNTVFPSAGTYGGINTNNGRVVYTASMP